VVSTASPDYSKKFTAELGFGVPGTMVTDQTRNTHTACGLKSSVYASLVKPFLNHLKTFGKGAIFEALRVSLKNATSGHGSSFQQGGTFVLKHNEDGTFSSVLSWREQYPGDWMQPRDILAECGVTGATETSWPEVLEFVVNARNGKGGGEEKEEEGAGEECSDGACNLAEMRAKMKAKEEAEKKKADAGGCDDGACNLKEMRARMKAQEEAGKGENGI
jgi:hypothetical protein